MKRRLKRNVEKELGLNDLLRSIYRFFGELPKTKRLFILVQLDATGAAPDEYIITAERIRMATNMPAPMAYDVMSFIANDTKLSGKTDPLEDPS